MSEVDFHFLLFLIEENGSYQVLVAGTTFLHFEMKKYCSLSKLLNFKIAKMQTITLSASFFISNSNYDLNTEINIKFNYNINHLRSHVEIYYN